MYEAVLGCCVQLGRLLMIFGDRVVLYSRRMGHHSIQHALQGDHNVSAINVTISKQTSHAVEWLRGRSVPQTARRRR